MIDQADMSPQPLLQVKNLSIAFGQGNDVRHVVNNASLAIRAGETTALVGESGSGKTLLARSLVGLVPPGAHVTTGDILLKGDSLVHEGMGRFEEIRGREISFIFQEPLSSLNPVLKVGLQLTEALHYHQKMEWDECRAQALEMLERVQIKAPEQVFYQYPHELSGGMRQRIMIATALMLKPALLIADEPTTALDMIVQEEVLVLMKSLAQDMGASVLLITHDLGSVAALADHVSVMNKGCIVEQGPVVDILGSPQNIYTRQLLAASPQPAEHVRTSISEQAPLLEVQELDVCFQNRARGKVKVLDGVSFSMTAGETLAIIGESGSGKTTLGRTIAGLQAPTSGRILFRGQTTVNGHGGCGHNLQFIFQDPFGSLDPRMRVGDIVAEGLLFNDEFSADQRRKKVLEGLQQVNLDPDFVNRYPHQLSGGQRQRVSIARAIVTDPDFIVADEPVSALDLTVQKQILDLLMELKQTLGFACLFVSHDLGVVEHLADRVGVLLRGRLVEIGSGRAIFNNPQHDYTRKLLTATPYLAKIGEDGYVLERRQFATS